MALLVYTLRPIQATRLGWTLIRKLESIPAKLYLPLVVLYPANRPITVLYAFP